MASAAFRVDASPASGAGHWTRCLALGGALSRVGVDISFVTARTDRLDEAELNAHGVRWLRLQEDAGDDLGVDARLTREALPVAPDWMVLDHYRLGADWESAARHSPSRLLALDDRPSRRHECDALLDPNQSEERDPYDHLLPRSCRRLFGPRYALLRAQFVHRRRRLRRQFGEVRRVLVFFGSADAQGWTLAAARAVRRALPNSQVDVVVGSASPQRERIAEAFRGDGAVSVHVQTPRMDELMASADLGVGAAGSATWERCCLGLPSVLVAVQENQQGVAASATRHGAAEVVDGEANSLENAVRRLGGDEGARATMSGKGMQLVDGRGAHRVRDYLFPLSVRPARADDMELLWSWANDPDVRRNALQQREIPWEDHQRWFAARVGSAACRIYIGEAAGKPVGQVRFDRRDAIAEIDVSLDAKRREIGLGKTLLTEAMKSFGRAHPGIGLEAVVRPENDPSAALFRSCGFSIVPGGSSPAGLLRFRLSAAETT